MHRVGKRLRCSTALIVLAASLLALSCEPQARGPSDPAAGGNVPSDAAAATRRPWSDVYSWVYWLNGPQLQAIGGTGYDLAVIDYSADGTQDGEFSAAQIEQLRHSSCERRVLAYLSIGEAENYRFYWQQAWQPGQPNWLLDENPDWPGNFRVRYWDPAWQQIVFQYLDRIIAQGFDGLYLDRVDAYQEDYAAGHEQDMVDFVLAIASYARARSPLGDDFGVVVQNAEELAPRHPDYVAAVTGIGREEVYVRATNKPTSADERAAVEADLDLFAAGSRGHLVLTVDYATSRRLIDDAFARARAKGYVPFAGKVELDRLPADAGTTPHCSSLPQAG